MEESEEEEEEKDDDEDEEGKDDEDKEEDDDDEATTEEVFGPRSPAGKREADTAEGAGVVARATTESEDDEASEAGKGSTATVGGGEATDALFESSTPPLAEGRRITVGRGGTATAGGREVEAEYKAAAAEGTDAFFASSTHDGGGTAIVGGREVEAAAAAVVFASFTPPLATAVGRGGRDIIIIPSLE